MKKLLLACLALTLVLCLLAPIKADAATYNGFTYTVSGGKATITDYSGSATNLTIPSTLGGYSVTAIGNRAFRNCTSLTAVTIGDRVTTIGSSAFEFCTSLGSVTIGNSVTYIGWYAFSNCTSLGSVTIPDSVESIGSGVFRNCTSLTGIWVDENNTAYSSDSYGVLFNKDKTTLIQTPGSISGNYTIPNSVTSIGDWAFFYRTSLTSVTIPDSVTSIGDYAFDSCTSLGSVTIPDSVTSIGNYAFDSCTSLTSVTIPDSVTTIGHSAFESCTRLTSVTIPDSVTSIGNYAFDSCTSLTSVTIPDSVTSIGDYAFRSCTSLTGIWVDENNTAYSSDSCGFLFNKDKTTLIQAPGSISGNYTIPNSVTSIGDSAFSYCTSLESVTIGSSVESIGDWAFYECTSLGSVTIGNSVESIGNYAFYNCDDLANVYYVGTQSQWESISIGSSNGRLTSATVHYQHIHDYTLFPSVTVDPTCTQNGYTEYTCVWGDTYRQMIPALGHDYTVLVETVAPTCLTEGYTTYKCSRCTATNTDYVEALGHDYTVKVETVAPTCLDDGYSVYRCVRCEETQTRDQVPALGHNYTVFVETVAPTCLTEGYTTYKCSRCTATTNTDYVEALDHDYSGTVTLVEPTCKDQGYTGTQCIRCDSIQKTNITNMVAHKLAILPAVDPTCTEPGLTLGTACKWCGMVGVAQKEVAALGGNCDYTADPTTCSNCGYVRADVAINKVTLRTSCAGLYFKGAFSFGAHETVTRYGIAVSLYNALPVADDSDETSLYTVGENSVLISNILDSSNGKNLIYARPYALLEDGTYIYGDVVATNLKAVVETIETQVFDSLTTVQKTAIADMYLQHTAAMQNWLIPKIKEFGEA